MLKFQISFGEQKNSLLKRIWLLNINNCSYPLSGEAEERVDQRSVVGVSRPGGHCRQCISANVRRG